MTKQISPKDWQTLSEYLDGQLPNRERVQIEARLQTSEDLRGGLEEIRRTRAVLRTLPKRRAPRNFILTPAMVPQRRIVLPRAFPYLRLASALASVLLVITFLSDLAVHNASPLAATSSNAPAPQIQAAPLNNAAGSYPAAPAPTQPPAVLQAPAAPAETTAPAAPEAPAAPNPAAQPTTAPTGEVMRSMAAAPSADETQQASIAMTQAPPGAGEGPNPAATTPVEATPAAPKNFAQALPSSTPAAAQDQAYPGQDTFGPSQAQRSQKVNPGAEASQPAAPESPSFEITNLLRPAEIIFAIIAVLTGLAAYLVYRAGRT